MFGYAFVNFVDELKALRARRIFEGLVSESAVRMAVVHCHLWFAALQKSRKIPSGKHTKNYGISPFSQWVNQLFLWAIFNSYVSHYQGVTKTSKTFKNLRGLGLKGLKAPYELDKLDPGPAIAVRRRLHRMGSWDRQGLWGLLERYASGAASERITGPTFLQPINCYNLTYFDIFGHIWTHLDTWYTVICCVCIYYTYYYRCT